MIHMHGVCKYFRALTFYQRLILRSRRWACSRNVSASVLHGADSGWPECAVTRHGMQIGPGRLYRVRTGIEPRSSSPHTTDPSLSNTGPQRSTCPDWFPQCKGSFGPRQTFRRNRSRLRKRFWRPMLNDGRFFIRICLSFWNWPHFKL